MTVEKATVDAVSLDRKRSYRLGGPLHSSWVSDT